MFVDVGCVKGELFKFDIFEFTVDAILKRLELPSRHQCYHFSM